MEKDITDLVEQMSNILSFVEDTEVLKEKLKTHTRSIESVLKMIKECSESIHSYLSAGTFSKRSLTLNS